MASQCILYPMQLSYNFSDINLKSIFPINLHMQISMSECVYMGTRSRRKLTTRIIVKELVNQVKKVGGKFYI